MDGKCSKPNSISKSQYALSTIPKKYRAITKKLYLDDCSCLVGYSVFICWLIYCWYYIEIFHCVQDDTFFSTRQVEKNLTGLPNTHQGAGNITQEQQTYSILTCCNISISN